MVTINISLRRYTRRGRFHNCSNRVFKMSDKAKKFFNWEYWAPSVAVLVSVLVMIEGLI